MKSNWSDRVQQNWQAIQQEVHSAAQDCGRDPASITVIGVTKYVNVDVTRALFDAGCYELAESRPQALWEKAEQLGRDDVRWHLIGHLQRNKIRRTLRYSPLIHSVDSQRLLTAISEQAVAADQVVSVLLEVNISGDDNKTGLALEGARRLVTTLPLPGVKVLGLMAMAGWGTGAAEARLQFQQLRTLRDELEQQSGHALAELSMGMSNDFSAAIAAGATMVRIGSRLFEGAGS